MLYPVWEPVNLRKYSEAWLGKLGQVEGMWEGKRLGLEGL